MLKGYFKVKLFLTYCMLNFLYGAGNPYTEYITICLPSKKNKIYECILILLFLKI